MKTRILTLLTLAAVVSCQEALIERRADGRLTLDLKNSPVVEVVTKAEEVSTDDFNVYVKSDDASFTYVYKDMPEVVTVPVGFYTVSAENVTETVSLSKPDQWGQVRYYGITGQKEVTAGINPVEYSLTCTMANTAVSVVFGENIDKHFVDYSVTAYTVGTRKLTYLPSNSKTGYFSPETLYYEFTGKYLDDSEPMTITGSRPLQPATHLHLTFRMSEQNGVVGKPEIIVDSTCDDLYETITVDPSEGGSFITNQ